MAFNLLNLICFIFILLLVTQIIHGKRNIPSEKTSSPLDSMKELEGCRKGNNTKAIQHLKTYLKNFGYLENLETLTNNYFDDALESAVKAFQKNYHTNPTGTIDSETISLMTKYRCGVPDIINGTNHMQRPHKNPNSSTIHIVSHFTFNEGQLIWPSDKTHLTYKFIGEFPEQAVLPVQVAFKKWANVSRFTFSEAKSDEVSDLTIGFYSGDHGDGFPFPPTTLAHSFLPTDGRLHFNIENKWFYLFKNDNAYDLLTVALHEIGHLLGLGHSPVREAIMYAYTETGETRDLQDDDIQGIRALYNF